MGEAEAGRRVEIEPVGCKNVSRINSSVNDT